MNITKSNIIKKIIKKSSISNKDGAVLFESLILFIKKQAKLDAVKITGFGTFSFKKTPKRIGRNPKTQDSYIIPELNKLNFKPSNKIKEKIN
jgi:integration host factor subunit alpha